MNRPGSRYIDTDTARRAVALVAPSIEAARVDPNMVGSGFLFLVVMDPALTPADTRFEEAILYEQGFGEEDHWDADYRRFARDKAKLAWREGLDSRHVQALAPHRLRSDDCTVPGGVCIDGIVVGASGAFPHYDELFAGAVALAVKTMARAERERDAAD